MSIFNGKVKDQRSANATSMGTVQLLRPESYDLHIAKSTGWMLMVASVTWVSVETENFSADRSWRLRSLSYSDTNRASFDAGQTFHGKMSVKTSRSPK